MVFDHDITIVGIMIYDDRHIKIIYSQWWYQIPSFW